MPADQTTITITLIIRHEDLIALDRECVALNAVRQHTTSFRPAQPVTREETLEILLTRALYQLRRIQRQEDDQKRREEILDLLRKQPIVPFEQTPVPDWLKEITTKEGL